MTKQEAIKAIKDNYPSSGYTMLCEGLDIAIECIENWSRVCEWIDSDSMKDIAEYVHRYGIEYIIECIEKHTPKEAKCRVSGNGWYGWIEFTCPVCGKEFKDSLVCPSCYQRVKPIRRCV